MKFSLNEEEILNLARFSETGGGQVLKKLLEQEVTKQQRELNESPCIDNENCKRDFRFRVGMIAGLNFILKASDTANQMIVKQEERNQP